MLRLQRFQRVVDLRSRRFGEHPEQAVGSNFRDGHGTIVPISRDGAMTCTG